MARALLVLLAALGPTFPARAQAWKEAAPLPTDMRETLRVISANSKLLQIYQLYRENRDGLQRGAERINLEEAISRGLAASPTLAEKVATIEASQWDSVVVSREWVPSLSVKTSDPGVLGYNTKTSTFTTKAEGSPPNQFTLYSHGFSSTPYANLAWSFFDPTRSVRQSALSSTTNKLRNDLAFSTRELILNIQTAYTNLQKVLGKEKDTIELFNKAIRIYIDAYKEGKPSGEVSRLEAQAVSFLITRINAHKDSIQKADALAKLLNLEPGKLALPSEQPEAIANWPLSRMDSIQRALRQREELQANAWEVRALRSDARAIRLEVLPSLSLSGQLKRLGDSTMAGSFNDNQAGTLQRRSGFESFSGLTFDWKVFDGGIRYARADAKDAKAQRAIAQDQNTRLDIGLQVADSYATFVASKILINAAKADVDASRLSLEGALKDYAVGKHDDAGTTVVQALTKLKEALDNYRERVAEQNLSIYQLYRYTASWPAKTEALVNAQYQRWLPGSTIPLLGSSTPGKADPPPDLQSDTPGATPPVVPIPRP